MSPFGAVLLPRLAQTWDWKEPKGACMGQVINSPSLGQTEAPLPTGASSPLSHVYILVRVCRMSGLTRPRVLTFPPKLSAPPLAERVCIYFGWESLSSNGSRKRVQPEKCSLQTPRAPMGGGRSLCRGGWENCVRFSWLFIGEEAWEEKGNMGGKDFLCSLGSKACSPNTAKNGWSLSRSALHISFCYWLR